MEVISKIIPKQEKKEPSSECCTTSLAEDQIYNTNMLNYIHLVNAECDDCETEETPNYNEYFEGRFQVTLGDLENNSKNCIKHDSDVCNVVDVKKEMDIGDTILQESDLSLVLKMKPEPKVVIKQDKTQSHLTEVKNSKNNIVIKIIKSQNGYEIASIKPPSETIEEQNTVSETQNKENTKKIDDYTHEFLTCYLCGGLHKGKLNLAKHLKRKHNSILNREINQTGKSGTNEQVYMCAHCDKTYAQKNNLIYHIHTKHEKSDKTQSQSKNTCQHCHKSFSWHCNLKKHLKVFHSEILETFECKICGSVFRQKSNLKVHYNLHLNQGSDVVKCNICSRMFNNSRLLQRHNDRIHMKRRNKQCQTCRRKYITQQRFDEHIKKCSESPQNKANKEENKFIIYDYSTSTFRCHLCSKQYYLKSTLQHHLKLHTSLTIRKKFECNDCQYKTFKRSHLVRHIQGIGCIRAKTRERNMQCKYCPKFFDTKTNMKMHLYRVCGTKSTGAECELCGKFMKRTAYMSEHRKKKHPKLVFKCDRCNETFGRRKDYLSKHIEKCFDL